MSDGRFWWKKNNINIGRAICCTLWKQLAYTWWNDRCLQMIFPTRSLSVGTRTNNDLNEYIICKHGVPCLLLHHWECLVSRLPTHNRSTLYTQRKRTGP